MQFLSSFLVAVLLTPLAFADPAAVPPAPDRFPNGCVDCHVQLPDRDVRLSTALKQWSEAVPPPLMEKARRVAGGIELTGKHPPLSATEVPGSCLSCHRKDSNAAPPFGALLHAIHLGGGDKNHFVSLFQGSCTHCHKADGLGTVTVAQGDERP